MSAKRAARIRLPGGIRLSGLGPRLLGNVMAIWLAAAAAIFLSLTAMIWSGFGRLEDADIRADAQRAATWQEDLRATHLAHVRDWAISDMMYRYLADFDPHFPVAYLNPDAFRNAQTDGMAFVRFSGESRAYFYDIPASRFRPDLARAMLPIVANPAVRQAMARRAEVNQFIRFNHRLYLLAMTPVLSTRPSDQPQGYLVFLRYVDPAALSGALQLPARFDFAAPGKTMTVVKHDRTVTVGTPVLGGCGGPLATLVFEAPRTMMNAGKRLRDVMLVATLAQLAALLLVLKQRIDVLVLDPVRGLHRQVARIRARGEAELLPDPVRDDELGALQGEFNTLTRELARLRDRIAAQSFALGRHQSSAGLIHNVRNSLSPVHVILSTLERHLARPVPAEAERALAELADPATPPERRARLAAYLGAVHDGFGAAQQRAREEAEAADRHLAAALDAIREGQADPSAVNQREHCELAPLLDRAALAGRFVRDAAITVSLDCPAALAARGNRVLLGQVFENLVTNAAEAIIARGGAGQITIRATEAEDRVVIELTDDGEGFPEDRAPRLFERGFSTRSGKLGGLGLHWCANTIGAMGGSIALTSPGAGQGATATIILERFSQARRAA
ncbi:MAG: hypothetical protein JSS36_05930 [Proteobacteria bacterium]|nr:hypothetical protein [Pseudomonadota bacterium]